MSPIGKIFIVVNLALAAAFLGWASNVVATSQDWKTKHDAVQEQMKNETEKLEGELSDLRTQLAAVTEDKDRAAQDRDDAKNRADRAERERDDQREENQQMRGDLTKLQSALDTYNQHLESSDARIERATDQSLEAERAKNEALQKMRDAEIALRDAEEAARSAEAKAESLSQDLAAAHSQLSNKEALITAYVEKTGIAPGELVAQPDIEGAVVSVRLDPAPGLVAINRGSEDGVKLGTTFDVFNGRIYKGRVRVEIVHPTWSSAILIQEGAPGSSIASGDSVATRL
jgi:hypothetical protein